MGRVWDVIIIGGGPASMQAAIAAASEGLKVLVLEKDKVGGQIGQTPLLENFIAANGGITGPDFAAAMHNQAQKMGAEIATGAVGSFSKQSDGNFLVTYQKPFARNAPLVFGQPPEIVQEKSRTVIIATGNRWQDLDIPGIKQGIQDRTVHYGPVDCLSVDPSGRDVAVYGGGPSAGQAIIALASKAKRVHVLMRSTLRMPQYLVDRINALPNVKLYEYAKITHLLSKGKQLQVLLTQADLGMSAVVMADHMFMCSGLTPNTEWVPAEIEKDGDGRILVGASVDQGSHLMTSQEGVFAIGDCRHGSTARVSAAIGDGAFVVTELWRYFKSNPVCSVCAPEDMRRAAAEYNPFRKGMKVFISGQEPQFPRVVSEVLNAREVRIDGHDQPVDVDQLRLAEAV